MVLGDPPHIVIPGPLTGAQKHAESRDLQEEKVGVFLDFEEKNEFVNCFQRTKKHQKNDKIEKLKFMKIGVFFFSWKSSTLKKNRHLHE